MWKIILIVFFYFWYKYQYIVKYYNSDLINDISHNTYYSGDTIIFNKLNFNISYLGNHPEYYYLSGFKDLSNNTNYNFTDNSAFTITTYDVYLQTFWSNYQYIVKYYNSDLINDISHNTYYSGDTIIFRYNDFFLYLLFIIIF